MSIRLKYILALTLIALSVSTSALIMQVIFESQKSDAEIINVAGQQRMLSQRIALYAERLRADNSGHSRSQLDAATTRFENNHSYLVSLVDLPEQARSMYFKEKQLHDRSLAYIQQNRKILNAADVANLPPSYTPQQTDELLRDLNEVVSVFENDANQRVEQVEQIELYLWMFTLCLLVLEALLIFRPLEQQIKEKITLLQTARDEARAAEQAANLANRAKSDFLASMSHELRTPMNGMFGMMELALDNPDRAQGYLNKAKNAGKQLLTLINDLLDFSKIEAGKINLEQRSCSLMQIIDDVVSVQEVHCRAKGLQFVFTKQTQLPTQIIGDSTRIAQMLHNLINNAVKFTDTGSVTLEVATFINDKRPWLHFSVKDTGIGIEQDKLDSIFTKFSQADQSTTRRFGGTGLGLSITQGLAEAMGGSVQVTSVVGQGSAFTLTFPTQIDRTMTSASHVPAKIKCAVVDDLETSCEYLSHVVTSLGMDAACFLSPIEFLASKQHFDIVLLDVAMPEMDGITALRQLVEFCEGTPPYVIFVTAMAEQLDVPDSLQRHVWQVHVKPVQRPELEKDLLALKAILSDAVPQDEPEDDAPTAHILVAEDNDINAEIVRTMLEQQGHSVTLASDGEKAVIACTHYHFDIIFMDMNMPNMDGLEATVKIRQTLKLDTPIIALTANAFSEDKERCKAVGMDGFIAKPINKQALFDYVDKVLADQKPST
ncbi:response regulator [Aestuariibacter salexigens]|uniref:response regulator n=1 Tax=Aestuariibacter salexigens TaxID=226010 RepID=UPI000410638F|nr:response regulator [Aestuariibacter salexigens]